MVRNGRRKLEREKGRKERMELEKKVMGRKPKRDRD